METILKINNMEFKADMDKTAHELLHNKEFEGKDICNYIDECLTDVKIDKLISTQLVVSRELGDELGKVGIYTFIENGSTDVINISNVPEHIRGFVRSGVHKPSNILQNEMKRFCNFDDCETVKEYDTRNGDIILYFKSDIVKVLLEFVNSNK